MPENLRRQDAGGAQGRDALATEPTYADETSRTTHQIDLVSVLRFQAWLRVLPAADGQTIGKLALAAATHDIAVRANEKGPACDLRLGGSI